MKELNYHEVEKFLRKRSHGRCQLIAAKEGDRYYYYYYYYDGFDDIRMEFDTLEDAIKTANKDGLLF